MVFNKTIVNWNEIHNNIELINNRTLHLDGDNVAVIGIARGGLIPATLLSQHKPNSVVFSIGIKSYIKTSRDKESIYQPLDQALLQNYSTLYLIDDICDTGLTYKFLLEKHFNNLKIYTISLYCRDNSLYKPDFFGTKLLTDAWVVFPWEKE